MALASRLDLRVFVSGVVVDDEMEIELFRNVAVDGAQEAQEFLMTMARHAFTDDLAGGDVERRKQWSSSRAACTGHRAGAALLQQQSRLRAIERLDLTLLVDRKHQRLVRRIEVEPDNVLNLFTKPRVIGELEAARQVRLQPVRRARLNALHARMAEADRRGHFAQRPVRAPRRLFVERHVDDASTVAASRGGLRPGRVASRSSPAMPRAR